MSLSSLTIAGAAATKPTRKEAERVFEKVPT